MSENIIDREKKYLSEIPISQAEFPLPFRSVLEFNAPAHGTWNIVHTGMLIPDAHQIYVCAANCMRGVVLTAAEMNCLDRFSSVVLTERDLETGSIEETTVQGVIDVLRRLPKLPSAVLLFTVCVHHFAGCSLKAIYQRLEEAFPQVDFVRCYMDPIMRKHRTPDEKMRKSLYEPLEDLPVKKGVVSLLGSDFSVDREGDLLPWFQAHGMELRQLPACHSYAEYRKMAEAECFLSIYPNARYGAEALAKRLGRPHLYLPMSFSYDQIDRQRAELERLFGGESSVIAAETAQLDSAARRKGCDDFLDQVCSEIGPTDIVIDYTVHPKPLGLARLLLEHGFRVKEVYLDAVHGEEEQDFYWLQKNAPDLLLSATVHPDCRLRSRKREEKVLALGQKAAWFTGTRHFVNVVQGRGWYGYAGILAMTREMREAYREEKDPEDLIPRKGLGCKSCI